ncbi:MAG: molybdate ABC transporter substrate-binding protein [Deltaproteobacteria bacterium]|nr:molybdate ABC transporter substrate-binding protein [Deltaproteobacteria bacterium]
MLVLGLVVCPLFARGELSPVTGELTVFAAASLTEAFTALGQNLESVHPGLTVRFNFGGSQLLRTQLENGARADLFATADLLQMDLARKSAVMQETAPVFARNHLVVIVPKTNPAQVMTFRDLAAPGLKLDLANATAPVGNYSRQAIQRATADYGSDFARRVLDNIVSEEDNVKQVVTKVQLGEADAGIVYVSDVTAKVRDEVLTVPIPDAYNQLAAYPIALTTDAPNRAAAEAFVALVLSAEGQAILQQYGFLLGRDY